jgi:hypothetical protein
VPAWLWRLAVWGFGLLLVGVVALAAALSFGLADPPRAGPLLWEADFSGQAARWEWFPPDGGTLAPHGSALVADFARPGQVAAALAEAPTGDFTLEAGAAQTTGASGAQYGLVFNWQSDDHYSAVLVNGNGYVEAYRQAGRVREAWFPFSQWPHVLVGPEANRVRVDVRGLRVTVRINDELLGAFEVPPGEAGRLGVMARATGAPGSTGTSRVVFSWVRVWAAER